jgi:hypothetical protein
MNASTIFSILTLAGIYFIPTIIAAVRSHQGASVFVMNLFLGWTLIGWVVALTMSVRDKPRHARA